MARLLLATLRSIVLFALPFGLATVPVGAQDSLPPMPEPVRQAMVAGDYDLALGRIGELALSAPEDGDFWLYLRGTAQALDGGLEQALTAFGELADTHPESVWAAKARFARAEIFRRLRRWQEAETIYEAEAARLLSDERKRELAGIYLGFADSLSKQSEEVSPQGEAPDWGRARALYAKVLELGAPRDTRDEALFRMGYCRSRSGDPQGASVDFEAYLNEFDPTRPGSPAVGEGPGERVFQARLELGRARLILSDNPGARRIFEDLLADLEALRAGRGVWARFPRELDEAEGQRLRRLEGDAAWELASTWQPYNEVETPLAIAALRRFAEEHVDHPERFNAGFRIAELYGSVGRHEEALEAYAEFIDAAGAEPAGLGPEELEELARLRMQASYTRGLILRDQRRFAEAIEVFGAYVGRYPTGPDWGAAQQAIVDSEYLIGATHRENRRFADARAAWRDFLEEHPLDSRARRIFFDLGQLHVEQAEELARQAEVEGSEPPRGGIEQSYRDAIAQWRRLVTKYPGTDEASEALFRTGELFEAQLGDLVAAIEAYRECNFGVRGWEAAMRLGTMTSPELTLLTERSFRSSEVPAVKVQVRNVEELRVELYRVDLEAYFRKHLTHRRIEELDLDLIAPDHSFEVAIEEYEDYAPLEQLVEIPVDGPGVWAVTTVADELRATTLVLRSDVDLIVKASRRELFVFAQDMPAGEPAAGVRVLVGLPGQSGAGNAPEVHEVQTDAYGIARLELSEFAEAEELRVLAERRGSFASEGLGLSGLGVAQGLTPRGYVYANRPAYQPGQRVSLRAILRDVDEGSYTFEQGRAYWVEVSDSQGMLIHKRERELSAFGTLHDELVLDEYAPTGTYRISARTPGGPVFAGSFRVEPYRLKTIELSLEPGRQVYYRGEEVEVEARVAWYYGEPLAGAELVYSLPDGRQGHLETDAEGRASFSFDSRAYPSEGRLFFHAVLPAEGVQQVASVFLAVRGYTAALDVPRDVYLAGEAIQLTLSTEDPGGEPVGRAMTLEVLRRESVPGGGWAEVSVEELALETAEADGLAHRVLSLEKGGAYVLRAKGSDRFGNPISALETLFVSGDEDETRLRLFADETQLEVGEDAAVEIHNRAGAGLALVTFEGERVFDYRLVRLEPGTNRLEFPVDHAHFPNFAISGALMRGSDFHQAALEFNVRRELRVTVRPGRETYAPGEEARFDIEVVDQLGRPVIAELSLAVVDAALYDLFSDPLGPVTPFFESGARRFAALRTTSTCGFAYRGQTATIAAEVLAELVRTAATEELIARRVELSDILLETGFDPDVDAAADSIALEMEGLPALSVARAKHSQRPGDAAPPTAGAVTYGLMGGGAGGPASPGPAAPKGSRPSDSGFPDAESAFWSPAIVTDEAGRASVSFPFPERSTRWRVAAVGVSADTIAGQSETSVLTRAELFVELKLPGRLTEGDRPHYTVRVHNLTGNRGEAQLVLRVTANGRRMVLPKRIELGDEPVVEVDFASPEPVPLVDGIALEAVVQAVLGGIELEARTVEEIAVRPWGVELAASASGRLTDARTLELELEGQGVTGRGFELYIGPGQRQLLVDEALGQGLPAPHGLSSQADSAGELMGIAAVLGFLRERGLHQTPEFPRLFVRGQALVSRLVAAQRSNGGWSWSGVRSSSSDPATSAAALFALGRARDALLEVPAEVIGTGVNYANTAFRGAGQRQDELKAMLQWALAANSEADFGALNRLHRMRAELSPAAQAYAALALVDMARKPMAADLAALLDRDDAIAAVHLSDPLGGCRWRPEHNTAWNRGELEMTALALMAIQTTHPGSERVERGVRYLEGSRPWFPARARGFALAALSRYYAEVQPLGSDLRLSLRIDDGEAQSFSFGPETPGKLLRFGPDELRGAGRAKVELVLEGGGELHYAAVLRGFSAEVADHNAEGLDLKKPLYRAAAPRHGGRELPVGFGILRGEVETWGNWVRHLSLGEVTHASQVLVLERDESGAWPSDDYLVLEVPLPAGCFVMEDSIGGEYLSVERADGLLRFHLGVVGQSTSVSYTLVGAVPGEYRVPPTTLRSAYRPERFCVQLAPVEAEALVVLERGAENPDPYRATPDELFHLGQTLYDEGARDEAHAPLLAVYEEWKDNLQAARLRELAEMLLFLSIDRADARQVVRFFEVLKEKNPDLTIPFEKVVRVGEAYRELEEHERAYLIFRATVEETFGKDIKVAAALEEEGEFLGSVRTLEELWLSFPDLPPVVETYLTVADKLLTKAPTAHTDEKLRREGIDRAALEGAGILLLQRFLGLYPENPLAPDAGLNLVTAYLGFEDYERGSTEAGRLAQRYTEPRFADAFQYTQAVADWYLGRNADALALLERIARAEYPDESGVPRPSVNRNLSLYILGQIHHALREPAVAIEYYQEVAEVFADAAEAIANFKEKRIDIDEVTVARPGEDVELELRYKNVKDAELLVYSVDLMTLYLREKNLRNITRVNLAGIAPALRETYPLGTGADLREQERTVQLALADAGAYLVICRGDELHTSGLVLVSPIELDVFEDQLTGRMRIEVLDHASGDYVRDVDVKVVGSGDGAIRSGKTDPRGLYVADAVTGTATVIARLDSDSYAFYRGQTALRQLEQQQGERFEDEKSNKAFQQFDDKAAFENVFGLNRDNQALRLQNLQEEASRVRQGVQVKQVQ